MKLLSLSIPKNEHEIGFRSLKPGFEIKFHREGDEESMGSFSPFCFAGLNGSGKSNVLEALANIFYHLEIMSARILPASIRNQKNFRRTECAVDVFKLEYLIGIKDVPSDSLDSLTKVIITKEFGKEPEMVIIPAGFDKPSSVSFIASDEKSAPSKIFLPDNVVGYSSGENELLSLPFIKGRFVQLDEYRESIKTGAREYKEPENSLIYIDNDMSQAVLLACLLIENEETLSAISNIDNTGILGLRRFTIYLTIQRFDFQEEPDNVFKLLEGYITKPDINENLPRQIEKLKKCATSWYIDDEGISFDFYVNQATKDAFKSHFNNSAFELFQMFHLLYLLNNHFIGRNVIEDVYQSKGNYTDWKVPVGGPSDDAFYFLRYYLRKEEKGSKRDFDLLLRDLSDGEHQFLHTTAICLMLKSRRTLLLLDEPETHFNPSWRAKFIKILNDSIEASRENVEDKKNSLPQDNIHLRKDILLTSHSPFIISDCMPNNVILFERTDDGAVTATKVSELEHSFNTYGTSVEFILDKLFNYRQSIGDLSHSVLDDIDFNNLDSQEKIEEQKDKLRVLGESIEKDMVLAKLNRISLDT